MALAHAPADTAAPPRDPTVAQLDAILSLTTDAFAVIDDDATICYVSPATALLMRTTAEALVGRSAFDLIHPDDHELAAEALLTRLGRTGEDLPGIFRLRTEPGEWCPVRVIGNLVEHAGRTLVALAIDPVEHAHVERALHDRVVAGDVILRQAVRLMGVTPTNVGDVVGEVLAGLGAFIGASGAALYVDGPDGTGELDRLAGWNQTTDEHMRAATAAASGRIPAMRLEIERVGHIALSGLGGDGWQRQVRDRGIGSLLLVGFPYRAGLGVVVIWRRKAHEWTGAELHVARSGANLIGNALARCDTDERFGMAFAQGPFGFGMVSWSGELLDANDRFREYFGEGTGGGRSLLDAVAPDDVERLVASLMCLRERPGGRAVEDLRVRRAGAPERVLRMHVCVIGNDTARSCLFALAEDITELTRRGQELVESEARSRALIESIPAIVMRLDTDGVILYCSPEVRSLGVDPVRLVGRNFADVIPSPDGSTAVWDRIASTTLRQARRWETEVSFDLPGTGRRCFEVRTVPDLDPDGRVLSMLVLALDVTERRELADKLEYAAVHDTLTGAATRDVLLTETDRMLSLAGAGRPAPSLLFVDLDRFKVVNDSLGHAAGDDVLRLVVERLRWCLRPEDLVARIGGDEFAVLLRGVSAEEAVSIADRAREALDAPFKVNGVEIRQTVSVGLAMPAGPDTTAEDLLRRADRAMYEAKQRGRNRYEVFDDDLRDEVDARVRVERLLRSAMERRELLVHFQPEVHLATRRIIGAEALVRWNHPDRGLLEAGEFIEVAEESGLIHEIGGYVLARSCEEFARIDPARRAGAVLRVNISAREFVRGDLVDRVASALGASGLTPESLCLEVTEHTIMGHPELADRQFELLRALGVGFAIDDFGIGYSSFSHLRRFPVAALKIDRSFVADLPGGRESRAIVASIVGLARALDLAVVAEGVESEPQAATLVELGCDRAQGYLFGRAMALDELVARMG